MIMADQLAAPAVGCYGNPVVQTPHMDQLAADGVVLENFYCNVPICAPSRASMMTGRLGARLRQFDNGTELPASVPTFLHHLRHGGYETTLAGKMHFVGPDQLHGFERRLTTDIYPSSFGWTKDWSVPGKPALGMVGHLKHAGPRPWTEQLIYDEEVHSRALEQLRAYGGFSADRTPRAERPWFLCVSYTHPHDPPYITPEWWNLYDEAEIDMPATPPDPDAPLHPVDDWLMQYLGLDQFKLSAEDVRRSRLGYYAMTSYFDSRVGQLVETLEQLGLRENTIVIVTSDHGDMVGEHGLWFKRTFYEWSARVPFIVSAPGRYPSGRRVEGVASLVDLFPTLLEMTGLPPATHLDGQSMAPLLAGDNAGEAPEWKDEAVIDFTSAGALHPWRAVRQGRYKYVSVHTAGPLLFDLEQDPNEWHNLAGQPEVAEVEAQLRQRVEADWDGAAIEAAELHAQQERLFVRKALQQGKQKAWDFQPETDAGNQYTR
jgi:choline-sulfatase